MHLFSLTEYHLSNQLIESLNYPGQETTMLGLLKYPDDFSKAQGLNQLWYKDTATTAVKAFGVLEFGVKFFGMDEFITQSNITPSDYKTLYPLFTVDVSKQKKIPNLLLYPNKGKFH